jgi:hypothetical protein
LPGEIVVGFQVPRRKAMRRGISKVNRKSGAFADSMAVFVEADDGSPPAWRWPERPRVPCFCCRSAMRASPKQVDAGDLRSENQRAFQQTCFPTDTEPAVGFPFVGMMGLS